MVRASLLAASACVLVAGPSTTAQTAGPSLALVVTYADGRVTESVVGPSGRRAWTPMFPRVPGWRDPAGVLPVTALNLRASLAGDRVRVAISVLRGRAHEIEDAIATIDVDVSAPVVVDDLRRVGLMPVTFAIKPFAAPALHVPRAASRVEGLDIDGIEPVTEPAPAYRITIRNTTDVPIVTVAFDTYVGGVPALSGQQGEPTALPIVPPGETFTFRLGAAGATATGQSFATATPLDDVVLTAAIWADGRTGGAPQRLAPLLALHRGRLATLKSVTERLRAESTRRDGDSVAALRRVHSAIAGLPSGADAGAIAAVVRLVPGLAPRDRESVGPALSIGSQHVRQRLLADLDRLMPAVTPPRARQWLDEALPACEGWLGRLHALFPAQ